VAGLRVQHHLVDLVPQFTAEPAQQRKLLVDNPARLYGFAPL